MDNDYLSEESVSAVDIDPNRLDEEWIKHPTNFFKAAEAVAVKRQSLAYAKTNLDRTKAALSLAIRSDPKTFGLEKTTEAVIEAAVLVHGDYGLAIDNYTTVKYELDLLEAVVNAFDHKKRALESLVQLHGMNYFSAPREKSETTVRPKAKPVTRDEVVGKKTPVKE